MKTLVLVLTAVLLLGFGFRNQNKDLNGKNNPDRIFPKLNCPNPPSFSESMKNEAKKKDSQKDGNDIDQNWYQNTIERIKNEEYNITYNEELGAYQSPNRENNIRFIYQKDGFTAVPRDASSQTSNVRGETEKDWSIDFKTQSVKSEWSMVNSELNVDGSKAHIENENMRIDYTNTKEGMRQDFIVKNKPEGEGKLRLDISADTKLKMIVGADALMFKDEKGIDRMKYSALKCWDANGKELRAYFETTPRRFATSPPCQGGDQWGVAKSQIPNRNNSKSFAIVVNDEDAVYPITIDPLSTSPDWTSQQNQVSANYGFSVATAGDVNGDKYSDVIIGSINFDNGQTDEGKVFVFYGSATGLAATADWTAESNQASAYFGGSVSTAGDVNGDGFSDIIIGAIGYDGTFVDGGAVYLWAGSLSGLGVNGNPTNASFSVQGTQANSDFGFSVSTAGDVNGDGYSDILISAQKFTSSVTEEGKVSLFLGSGTGPTVPTAWSGLGSQLNARFGCSVATAGDVNGDGKSDVIIGSSYYDNGETDEGRIFIWYGATGGLGADGTPFNADWSGESNQVNAHLGVCVATAGDVNGDGYSDIITGADLYDNGQTNEGKVFMWYGSASGPGATGTPTNADWSKESNQADADLGYIATTAGDVNGDGYSDILVSAYLYDNGQTNEGKVWAYFGSSSGPDTTADWTAESDQANADFGFGLATAGDVNGDGYSDVIAGAILYDEGQTDEGKVFLYNGSPMGLSDISNWTKSGTVSNDNFGASVSSAGDINGDGYSDVLVGAPFYDGGQTDEGRVYLFVGDPTGLKTSVATSLESNQDSAHFGQSVSTAGDVNGDGYCDVIIGAPNYTNGQTHEGRAYIYLGSAGATLTVTPSLEINQSNANFGTSVSTAGDVNGDGYSDVIVGADNYDNGETNEGGAYVYYGSSVGILTKGFWSAEGNQTGASFGGAVSTAGDVNGDGYSDILIGSSYYDNGQTDEGRAYVYYGSSTGLSNTTDWTAESNDVGGRMGFSTSTAGDINGDGFADIIVGAVLYSNGNSNEGGIFVWNGSSTGLGANGTPGNADWSAESNQTTAQLGWSVSTAGDVNGDGYSDVIAGARLYDNGENAEGRVFLWQGSSTGLGANGTPGNADWSAESNQANAHLGVSVSSAGDVNGDGYSDVICGAPEYDDGLTNNGIAFTYYGNGGNGIKTIIAQYEPLTSNIIYSGARTGTNGQVRLGIFAKSPFGRADGRIVFEFKTNGLPFSGDPITNSTTGSGTGSYTDMGTTITGVPLNYDLSGLAQNKEFKWRSRVRYDAVNNPYQMLGPWKYYTNYVSVPFGCFKAITVDDAGPSIVYTNLSDSVGGGTRTLTGVTITDASGVNGTSGSRPRIYYKVKSDSNIFNDNTNATDGWKFSEASNSNSPFQFIINYGKLNGGISALDTIQYFVIAQDIRNFGPIHVGITNGTFASTPYNDSLTSAAFPITGLINSYKITDNIAPSITFTNLADTASLTNRNLYNVVITDVSGINGTSGTRPRVYYKKISNLNQYNDNTNATQGWKYAEATGATSPFSFVINYSLINGGLKTSDTLVYFVVAQDLAPTPNIKIVQGTFAAPPASVNLTSAAFPIGGSLKGYKITDLGAPAISFSNLADTTSLSNRSLNNVVITDSSGIQGSSGFRPRVYFKKTTNANTFVDNTNSTNGWKYASASGSTSPFSFTIDYSLLNGSIAANDSVQYFVVAQDIYIPPFVAINSGTFSASPSSVDLTSAAFPLTGSIKSYKILPVSVKTLFLTTLIQGFYDAGSDIMVPDTVTVYLRSSISPYDIIDTSKILLGTGALARGSSSEKDASGSSTGFGVCSFNNALNGVPYYILLSHRNSIETWSGNVQSFVLSQLIYDFTTAANLAYGDNMIQVNSSPVRFAMYGGDVNQDGTVDASDLSAVENDASNSVSGYVPADLTGDDFVDAGDLSIVENNAAASVTVITP